MQAVIKHFFNIGKHDGIPGIVLHLSVVVCYYRNFWDSDSENLDIHESDLARICQSKLFVSGFGGLEVACWPLVPKFAGSNPAEAVGFFRAKKSSARLLSEGK